MLLAIIDQDIITIAVRPNLIKLKYETLLGHPVIFISQLPYSSKYASPVFSRGLFFLPFNVSMTSFSVNGTVFILYQ